VFRYFSYLKLDSSVVTSCAQQFNSGGVVKLAYFKKKCGLSL